MLDQAGYEYRKFHAPRHTFASLLVSANPPTPLIAIKEQMGHHSMQMTVDIYGKFINSGQGITFILDSPPVAPNDTHKKEKAKAGAEHNKKYLLTSKCYRN